MDAPARLLQAIQAKDVGALKALLDADPLVARRRPEGAPSPLLLACYLGDRATIDLLLARGVIPDIHEAAALGRDDHVAMILVDAPDASAARSGDGWTPLHLAAHFGHERIVRLLLDHRADLTAKSGNATGNTPLHAAVAGRHAAVVARLLQAGADSGAKDAGGNTPLHVAAAGGAVDIVETLLAAGADPAASNQDGQAPADIARARGHEAAARLLA